MREACEAGYEPLGRRTRSSYPCFARRVKSRRHVRKPLIPLSPVTVHGLSRIEAGPATLVVHSGTIRAALCIALDLAPQAALRFVIDSLSLTRIDRLATGWRVVSVNQRVA